MEPLPQNLLFIEPEVNICQVLVRSGRLLGGDQVGVLAVRTSQAANQLLVGGQQRYDMLRTHDGPDTTPGFPLAGLQLFETLINHPQLARACGNRIAVSVSSPCRVMRTRVRQLQEANPDVALHLIDQFEERAFWEAWLAGEQGER